MRKKKKQSLRDKSLKIAVLPAFNARISLSAFLERFPFELFDQVILVDDYSEDGTFEFAKKYRKVRVFRNSRNLGYGGNLKVCLGRALDMGADVIVEIHPDGEYGFDGIEPALKEVECGAKLVLGNRFEFGPRGMAIWKVPFTLLLSRIGNLVLGTNVPDLHQGFRVYTRELLESIPYRSASNNYIFSFEIIAQTVFNELKISSVPVSAIYKGKKRGVSFKASVLYTLGVVKILVLFVLAKIGLKSRIFLADLDKEECIFCGQDYLVNRLFKKGLFSLFWCGGCRSGFTFPQPKNINDYYPEDYWGGEKGLGRVRRIVFKFFQRRRVDWVRSEFKFRARILDVGSGEAEFAEAVKDEFKVFSLENRDSKVKNRIVLKMDFLKFEPKEKFDGIVFWESLEHVEDPQKYIVHAGKLLKTGGRIFVEYPKFNCLESKIFGESWFHLDLPRHLVHFTKEGIVDVFERNKLSVHYISDVLALEYCVPGFFMSCMSVISPTINRFKFLNGWALVLLSPLILVGFILECVLFTINQSPIGLLILKKR